MDDNQIFNPKQPWQFPTVYKEHVDNKVKKSAKTSIHYWTIGYNGEDLVITHGTVGGKVPKPIITQIGINSDAVSLARTKLEEKMREGYSIDTENISTSNDYKCMLAGDDIALDSNLIVLNCPFPNGKKVAVSPKLDGARGVVRINRSLPRGQRCSIWSRNGKEYVTLSFLCQDLDALVDFIPLDTVFLDGEIYVHGWTNTKITGCLKASVNRSTNALLLKLYLFDLKTKSDLHYLERYDILNNAILQAKAIWEDADSPDRLVVDKDDQYKLWCRSNNTPCERVIMLESVDADTYDEISDNFRTYLEQGFEGGVIRLLDQPYKSGSRKCMFKLKAFKDEEGIIVGVEECKGTQKDVPKFKVLNTKGEIFGLKYEGNLNKLKGWLLEYKRSPLSIIGRLVTYKYQISTSDDGYTKPRIPVGKGELGANIGIESFYQMHGIEDINLETSPLEVKFKDIRDYE